MEKGCKGLETKLMARPVLFGHLNAVFDTIREPGGTTQAKTGHSFARVVSLLYANPTFSLPNFGSEGVSAGPRVS
jgi:hypothetical protein